MKAEQTFPPTAQPFSIARIDIPAGQGQSGYCGVSRKAVLKYGKHGQFMVVVYGAYCADGLFGPEQNGIAILDVNLYSVLLDRHEEQTTGYFGPNQQQVDEWDRIVAMEWEDFQDFVNSHPMHRYDI